MIRSKNISLTKLALLASVFISVTAGVLVFFFSASFLNALITLGVIGVLSGLLIYNTLQRFIYPKIKLIYKFISQTKATPREEFYNNELLPRKTLEEVNEDVEKWAEERKGEIEQLRNNEQFRKEFLMNLAHELKTPIFSAQGYIDTLLDGALHDPEVNQTFLSNASRSIDRLVELVDDLDVISKLESNRIPIVKSEFVMQDLIREVFDELRQRADTKNIKMGIKRGCESSLSVMADKQKIKQVLVNLIENSLKYGKDNGETTAGIYVVDDKNIYTEITDNGIGMQEEHVPRVFERFYRTDTARSRNVGGTGLGLAIVKHIIEAHGHPVVGRSTLNVGSSFGFTLDRSML